VLGRVNRPAMSALRQTGHFADVVKWTRMIPKRDGRASKSRLAGVKSCSSLEASGMSGLLFGC
jgi:hypothetical protein